MSSSALMAPGSRSVVASDPIVAADAGSAAGSTAVPAVPLVRNGDVAASVLCCSATGRFDSTDCRLQEIHASDSTTAVAQAVLRSRSGYIYDLRPGRCATAAPIDHAFRERERNGRTALCRAVILTGRVTYRSKSLVRDTRSDCIW